jgi:hypothetical protein
MVIISDDAGQFNIFLHALCWIHAERTINKLVGFNEQQRQALVDIQNRLWNFYSDLKFYKENPCSGIFIPTSSFIKKIHVQRLKKSLRNNSINCLLPGHALPV